MSFAKHGIASQAVEFGRTVLTLAALGIFAKLLKIDLAQLQVLGVSLGPASVKLIPGLLGLTLIYALAAFVVARAEAAIEEQVDKEAIEARKAASQSRPAVVVALLVAPLSFFVYLFPLLVGIFTVVLLWSDSMAVLGLVWGAWGK